MRTPQEALRALARPGGDPVTIRQMIVSAANDDGTVNIAFGNQVVTNVAALASYAGRAEGDKVAVAQTSAGWLVLGRAGDEPEDPPVKWSQVTGKPQIVSMDFGEAGPPAGFSKVAALYVKDGAIYADTSVASGGGGGGSPVRVPDDRTVFPDDDAAYRFGSATEEPNPIQGAWSTSSYPAYRGAWFYGTKIKAACDAGTVDYIEMGLTRSSKYHGIPRGVPTRLYLHATQNRSNTPPNLFNPTTGPSLELGERKVFRLPGDWVTALANGSARGIGCYADKGGDYLIYGSTGTLTIHFK